MPPRITISVKGAKVIARGIQKLNNKIPVILDSNVKNAIEGIATKARKYPRERDGQKYKRTYKLRDSVRVIRVDKGKYTLSIDPVQKGNHYARYVIGLVNGEGQAWMHEGRWYLFRDIVESGISKLPKTINEHLKRATQEVGKG